MAFHKVTNGNIGPNRLRNMNLEHGTGTVYALDQNTAVHHFNQFLGQIQSKARTFNISVAVQVDTFKALEQFIAVHRTNANTRIRHHNHKINLTLTLFIRQVLEIDRQIHRALGRVLNGIRKQIVYNLAQANLVAFEFRRNFRAHVDIEFQILALSTWVRNAIAIVQYGKQVVFTHQEFHFARFDFRDIQDIIHQRKKRVSRILNILRVFEQSFVFALLQQHGVHAQNTVDWRADFMAHVGQEKAFSHIRRFCILSRFFGLGPSLSQFIGMLRLFAGIVQIFEQPMSQPSNGNTQKCHGNGFNQKARRTGNPPERI